MPGFDRTGPEGKGSATGRGMGPCGVTEKQLDRTRPRRGNSPKGRGGARGRRRGAKGITYFV